MKFKWVYCFLLLLTACASQSSLLPKDTNRIVFIGDSITYTGKYVAFVEAYLRISQPNTHFEFVNIGLPSETVSGLSEPNHAGGAFLRPDAKDRLQRSLDELKPDVVFSCYGINDGIYMPYDDARFKAFKQGLNNHHHTIVNSGAKVIHVTPPDYDERVEVSYSRVMDKYAAWLLTQRETQGWQVIDIHFPMKLALKNARLYKPAFYFSKDGIHPNTAGHWQIAKVILTALGETPNDTFEQISGHNNPTQAKQLYELVLARQTIIKDAYLAQIGHERPRMKIGLPLQQAKLQGGKIDEKIAFLVK